MTGRCLAMHFDRCRVSLTDAQADQLAVTGLQELAICFGATSTDVELEASGLLRALS